MTDTFHPLEFHPLANLFPLIEGPDFDALVEDIRAHGLRERIVLLDDKILDGRNRYRALVRLIETGEVLGEGWDSLAGDALFPEQVVFPVDACGNDFFVAFCAEITGDPLAFVLSKNLNRRHLDDHQRTLVAGRIRKLRQGARTDLSPIGEKSQAERAEMMSVSKRAVERVDRVFAHGSPELVEAIESGEVSISAAAEIANLPMDDQREIVARGESQILKAAKEINAEKRERRRAERFSAIADIARASAPLPKDRKYPVIYADPPWRFDSGFGDRSIENHYPTMSVEDICALPVRDLAHDDAVLFMWVTVPHLESAFTVLRAWGFAYKSSAMWDKEESGTGYWFFNQHEILIVATRGSFPAPEGVVKARSVYRERKGKHSAKPDYYYGLIERMTPGLPRVELFSRGSPPGWDAWGNQAGAQESCERTESSRASATTESNEFGITPSHECDERQDRTSMEHFPEASATAAASTGGGVAPASQDNVADDDLAIPVFLRRKSAAEQAEVAP